MNLHALVFGAFVVAALPFAKVALGAAKASAGRKLPAAARIITLPQLQANLAKRHGRVAVLHVWASWCIPCLEELPMMGKFARDMKPRGIDLVSVSLDDATPQGAQVVARLIGEKTGGAMQNVILKVDNTEAFLGSIDPRWDGTIPALFFYDANGSLRRALMGNTTREEVEKFATALLPEKK